MSGARGDVAYLGDMISACERVRAFSAGISDAELMCRELPHRGAVLHELIVLGEASKQLSVHVTSIAPGIPWADVARLRDKLVHYYHGLDDAVLLDVVRNSVPEILPGLRRVIAEL